jgi:acetate kinase
VKKLDAICFTGAIGAGDPVTRKAILKDLGCAKGVKVFTFESEEELVIAKEVKKFL